MARDFGAARGNAVTFGRAGGPTRSRWLDRVGFAQVYSKLLNRFASRSRVDFSEGFAGLVSALRYLGLRCSSILFRLGEGLDLFELNYFSV